MNSIVKTVTIVTMCVLASASVVGCNTVKGAGRDIERGGEKVQGAVEGVQDN